MKIEFFSVINYEIIGPQYLEIDIDENSPIQDLLNEIHELTKTPKYIELIHDEGETVKISCWYFYKSGKGAFDFVPIHDLQKKIASFPKFGLNDSLSIKINDKIGGVN